jgi:hypothetical protein
MPKSKRTAKKPSVKVRDLRPKKNPKGGSMHTATGKHLSMTSLPHHK